MTEAAPIASRQPHPMDTHIGRRIRLRRTLLGVSQQQLAAAVGVTFQQIQKYETGINRMSAARLYDVARSLGVPEHFFFDDLDDEEKDRNDTKTESLDLVRAYWALPTPDMRRNVLDLLKAMGA